MIQDPRQLAQELNMSIGKSSIELDALVSDIRWVVDTREIMMLQKKLPQKQTDLEERQKVATLLSRQILEILTIAGKQFSKG